MGDWPCEEHVPMYAHLKFSMNIAAIFDIQSQRLLRSPLAVMFRVAVLFVNFRTCISQYNQISEYFGVEPPSKHCECSQKHFPALAAYLHP